MMILLIRMVFIRQNDNWYAENNDGCRRREIRMNHLFGLFLNELMVGIMLVDVFSLVISTKMCKNYHFLSKHNTRLILLNHQIWFSK